MAQPSLHKLSRLWLQRGAAVLVCASPVSVTVLTVHTPQPVATTTGRDSATARVAGLDARADPIAAIAYEADGVEGDLYLYEHFPSQVLGDRNVFVFLPSEYRLFDERRYPVLYVLDAQNFFDPALAAGGEEWALDEILVRHPDGVAESIVIGVVAGAQAVREFSPPGSTSEARGDAYVGFLTDKLKPFVDARYRTLPDRSATWIVGQSGSAVLAVYAAWVRSDVFAGAIALDFPDVDPRALTWSEEPPKQGRPWYWLEQTWSERSRRSTTDVVAVLERHASVQVVVTGYAANRAARVLAALRALPIR